MRRTAIRLAFSLAALCAADARAESLAPASVLAFADMTLDGEAEVTEPATNRVIGFGLDSEGDRQATYASAGVDFAFGSFEIGRPRSILEQGPMPLRPSDDAGLRALATEAALDERLGPGVALTARSGAFSLGTSVHRTDEADEVSILGLAGRVEISPFSGVDRMAIYGGAETDGNDDRLRLGTEVGRGRATVGLDVMRGAGETDFSMGQVYLGLSATPLVTLGITGARTFGAEGAAAETRFGIGATYAGSDGTFFSGGVADAAGESPAFDLSVGFQF